MDKGTSRVLNDVNMDIQRGETLGVVGESGSGKSMFADALLDAVVDPGILTGEIIYHRKTGNQSTCSTLPPGNCVRSAGKTSRWCSRAQ